MYNTHIHRVGFVFILSVAAFLSSTSIYDMLFCLVTYWCSQWTLWKVKDPNICLGIEATWKVLYTHGGRQALGYEALENLCIFMCLTVSAVDPCSPAFFSINRVCTGTYTFYIWYTKHDNIDNDNDNNDNNDSDNNDSNDSNDINVISMITMIFKIRSSPKLT